LFWIAGIVIYNRDHQRETQGDCSEHQTRDDFVLWCVCRKLRCELGYWTLYGSFSCWPARWPLLFFTFHWVIQKSLWSRRFRELAEIIHQLTDIDWDVLFPTCSALVQSRDPLFKHFGKHSNRDRFQNCSHRRDHLVFGSEVPLL
jgi:hypothetical protein